MIYKSSSSASESQSSNSTDWHLLMDHHLNGSKKPLIVILGPTASGKTDFSLDVAQSLIKQGKKAEIINADSRQLYKYLDIGTAKVSSKEMRGITHHLMDVLDPKEEVTISWYKKEAERLIDQLHQDVIVPILVGGSMLYISAIIDGLEPLPAVDPALRKKLEDRYDLDQGKTLMQELMQIDPDAAASIPIENKIYLVRALEIISLTGDAPSKMKKSTSSPYDLLIIGMNRPRSELMERIHLRTKTMFKNGWMEEVRSLIERGYSSKDPAMKSHGYREIALALEKGNIDQEILQELISAKTRHYAKRQMTWWRGDERIHWLTT